MNAKDAEKMLAYGHHPDIDLRPSCNFSKGFLEAVKGAEPLVEFAQNILRDIHIKPCNESVRDYCECAEKMAEVALEKYKREVLGEER